MLYMQVESSQQSLGNTTWQNIINTEFYLSKRHGSHALGRTALLLVWIGVSGVGIEATNWTAKTRWVQDARQI